jgi:hypothetical protein
VLDPACLERDARLAQDMLVQFRVGWIVFEKQDAQGWHGVVPEGG